MEETERALISSIGSAAGASETIASTANKKISNDLVSNQATAGPLDTTTSYTTNRFGANPQEDRVYSNQ